jgi:hypothetical protein
VCFWSSSWAHVMSSHICQTKTLEHMWNELSAHNSALWNTCVHEQGWGNTEQNTWCRFWDISQRDISRKRARNYVLRTEYVWNMSTYFAFRITCGKRAHNYVFRSTCGIYHSCSLTPADSVRQKPGDHTPLGASTRSFYQPRATVGWWERGVRFTFRS